MADPKDTKHVPPKADEKPKTQADLAKRAEERDRDMPDPKETSNRNPRHYGVGVDRAGQRPEDLPKTSQEIDAERLQENQAKVAKQNAEARERETRR